MEYIKQENSAHYRPMPHRNRFWVYAEHCYTEDELNLRKWLLNVRSNSGIHPDYLSNPNSWFTDDEQALINVNKNSWVFSDAYKPRHTLSRDDFHVQPIDGQRLQWPILYDLMQKTGDYLLLRNQDLPDEHLNQPMNFVLLDVIAMLKALSQNTNINQVKEQLEFITQYIRTIEKNVSPIIGSDRLFLATFRSVIDDDIHPMLTHKIESQLLRDRLHSLSKIINKLSSDRNRILHFALNINPVNPHPYGFAIDTPNDSKSYPTQVAKGCAQTGTELIDKPLSQISLTVEKLKTCKDFKLISMNEEVLTHYADAITDLNELERFQKVINDIINLLGQAGEVYTIHQFKQQMLTLFNEIRTFIDSSSIHIEEIIKANTLAYHHAIQQEQDLTLWKKWLTSEQKTLQTYIKNQDNLAQFPSSTSDLKKTNRDLMEQVEHIVGHLTQPYKKDTSFEGIAHQAQELNGLMDSMHQWISNQYNIKGLEAPARPEPLRVLPSPNPELIEPIPDGPVEPATIPTNNYGPLFAPKSFTDTCSPDNNFCQSRTQEAAVPQNTALYIGLATLLPIGLIALYLLYRAYHHDEATTSTQSGTKEEFDEVKTKIEDFLTDVQGYASLGEDEEEYQEIIKEYQNLIAKSKRGHFDVQALESAYTDLLELSKDLDGLGLR